MSKIATIAMTALALTVGTATASLAASRHFAEPHTYTTRTIVPATVSPYASSADPFVWSSVEEARIDPARGYISGE